MSGHPVADFPARLARGERLLGTLLTLPSPEIAELVAGAGFDWLFVDMEHGLLDFEAVQRMLQAVAASCACLVRVPANEPNLVGKALDAGADGIIVPHVASADAARAAVRAAKYPPDGVRSIGVCRAQRYGRRLREAIAGDNAATVVVAQVEDAEGAANIEEIAAVAGLGAVFVGPFDLSASLGRPGEIGAPEVRAAMARIRSACAARPLPCGVFFGDAESARRAFAEGYSLVCAATDTLLLGEAAARLRAAAAGGEGDGRA